LTTSQDALGFVALGMGFVMKSGNGNWDLSKAPQGCRQMARDNNI